MADSISSYSDLYSTTTDSSSELSSTLSSTDYSDATDDELMDVCKQFEAYFIEQMYKSMEATIPESDDEDSSASAYMDMFGDTLTEQYGELASESNGGEGIGLAQMLYEQMQRNYDL